MLSKPFEEVSKALEVWKCVDLDVHTNTYYLMQVYLPLYYYVKTKSPICGEHGIQWFITYKSYLKINTLLNNNNKEHGSNTQ